MISVINIYIINVCVKSKKNMICIKRSFMKTRKIFRLSYYCITKDNNNFSLFILFNKVINYCHTLSSIQLITHYLKTKLPTALK